MTTKRDNTESLLRCALDTYDYWASFDKHGWWFKWATGLHEYRAALAEDKLTADLDWATVADQARENARRAVATCEERKHLVTGRAYSANAASRAAAKSALATCDSHATNAANGEERGNEQ